MNLRELFEAVAAGSLTPGDAQAACATGEEIDLGFARLDVSRAARTGVGEVVFCEGKTPEQAARILSALAEREGAALGTRATPEQFERARAACPAACYSELARVIRIGPARPPRGRVAVVAAGTSDLPVAEEAVWTAEHFGAQVDRVYDAGVAGLHRLMRHLPVLRAARAVIAVAGMEGALPSVVGGLVAAPVIAVPTSIGYGASFHGLAALLAMLNSCAPGVTVVNIDNGFGAAVAAVKMLSGGETPCAS
jgi:pyridinium-3,5-biscarboxylic acid mononucleotide synthase